MNSTTMTTERLLTKVLHEVRSLRRDVSLIIPSESIDEYINKQEIDSAYRAVQKTIALSKRISK